MQAVLEADGRSTEVNLRIRMRNFDRLRIHLASRPKDQGQVRNDLDDWFVKIPGKIDIAIRENEVDAEFESFNTVVMLSDGYYTTNAHSYKFGWGHLYFDKTMENVILVTEEADVIAADETFIALITPYADYTREKLQKERTVE